MRKEAYTKYGFLLCVFVILLLIVVSRGAGITFNLSLHPDESEFYVASESLAQSLLDPDVEFYEEKEYPEGGYVLQLPFQLIKEFLGASHWFWRSSQCWSRISSVFYFVLSVIYGMMILTRYMSRSKLAAILYALTMCFSLFFIEHSRYGVGDMGSLFLLMVTVYHCARGLETRKWTHLALAFFCTGVLGAVKYPQIFFVVIPAGTYLHMDSKAPKKKAAGMALFLLAAVIGLLMFSPKAALDPAYFLRVLDREGKAYVTEGTTFNSGGPINHALSILLYTLLYSDFPLSLLLVGGYFCKALLHRNADEGTDYLFHRLLPVVTVVFLSYNLFAKLFVFRTLTPFFAMTALYSAEAAAKLCAGKNRRIGRIAVVLLTCLMVFRGGWLLAITGHQGDDKEGFTAMFAEAVDDSWNQVILFEPYNIAAEYSFAENMDCPEDLTITETSLESYMERSTGLTMQPGELVVTGAYEYALMAPYFVSYEKSITTESDDAWVAFKQANESYYVDQTYPSSYYYIFGGWIRGGTLSASLIPCNMVYYRGA